MNNPMILVNVSLYSTTLTYLLRKLSLEKLRDSRFRELGNYFVEILLKFYRIIQLRSYYENFYLFWVEKMSRKEFRFR